MKPSIKEEVFTSSIPVFAELNLDIDDHHVGTSVFLDLLVNHYQQDSLVYNIRDASYVNSQEMTEDVEMQCNKDGRSEITTDYYTDIYSLDKSRMVRVLKEDDRYCFYYYSVHHGAKEYLEADAFSEVLVRNIAAGMVAGYAYQYLEKAMVPGGKYFVPPLYH